MQNEEAKTVEVTLLRRSEIARRMGVSLRTVYEWTRRGVNGVKLECLKLGKTVRYDWAAVERFCQTLDSRKT